MGLGQRKSRTFRFTWPVHNFPTNVTLVLSSDSRTFPYRAKDIANFSQRYINQDWTSLVAQMVRNLPVMWETWVQSLGQEESLEKGMATHSSILVWRIPWTEEPGGLQSMGLQRIGHNWATKHASQDCSEIKVE